MKTFTCQHCNQAVFFDNSRCESCGATLGFNMAQSVMVSLQPGNDGNELYDVNGQSHQLCANHQQGVCNWLVSYGGNQPLNEFCEACDLNRYIPNITNSELTASQQYTETHTEEHDPQWQQWQELEQAKKRLIYSLNRFRLPVISKQDHPDLGLSFDFIDQSQPLPEDAVDTTGHAQGQITITTDEADPAEREQNRVDMGESYRTLLGHFRHEIGHYYWDLLIAQDDTWLSEFRTCFGDETKDYQVALAAHYQQPNTSWRAEFISEYASAHPWEDWAESWAHYFHLIDTIDTAIEFGIAIKPLNASLPATLPISSADPTQSYIDVYNYDDFTALYHQYIPITLALNSLNRSLGQADFYPFVLNNTVFKKLEFIHRLIRHKALQ